MSTFGDLDFDAIFTALSLLESKAESLAQLEAAMRAVGIELAVTPDEIRRDFEAALRQVTFLREQLKIVIEDREKVQEVMENVQNNFREHWGGENWSFISIFFLFWLNLHQNSINFLFKNIISWKIICSMTCNDFFKDDDFFSKIKKTRIWR